MTQEVIKHLNHTKYEKHWYKMDLFFLAAYFNTNKIGCNAARTPPSVFLQSLSRIHSNISTTTSESNIKQYFRKLSARNIAVHFRDYQL